MMFTYYLHGGPKGEPRTIPGQPDEPGQVLSIERRTEAGMVDLYILTNRSDAFGTCAYHWYMGGTPEETMAAFAKLAREAQS